jgi:hypothetical protein
MRGGMIGVAPTARRGAIALAAAAVILAAGAGPASAVTRYAAPGGTATDDVCVTPTAAPCSIGAAAGGTNVLPADEAIILPGEYSDTAGDLDGDDDGAPGEEGMVQPRAGSVHGAPGQPRPVITLNGVGDPMFPNPYGAFLLGATTLSHVEIEGGGTTSSLTLGGAGSIVDGVVARSSRDNAIVCNHWNGILRNSACLSSGSGGISVGASLSTFAQNTTLNVRNVTAVATGTGSFGLDYFFGGAGANLTISAKGVIAQGTSVDARARATTSATTTVNLDHSNFDTVSTSSTNGGVGTITAAGTGAPNFNQTTPATLAADGYHQLAGSSTINTGQTDGLSGTQDIDGQNRQIGLAPPDIGADELGIGSTTTVSCVPATVTLGSTSTCTATVTAPAEFINGSVSFSSDIPGATFGGGGSCALPSSALSTQCQVSFTPGQIGAHQVSAVYSGDSFHDGSQGSTAVTVSPAPAIAPPTATVNSLCATLRKKLKVAKKAGNKAKVRKLRRKLRRLGC